MKIQCPNCNHQGDVPDNRIPDSKVQVTCPKCNHKFGLERAADTVHVAHNKETKNCTYCGEEILAIAIKCKHCGSMLEEAPVAINGDNLNAVKPLKCTQKIIDDEISSQAVSTNSIKVNSNAEINKNSKKGILPSIILLAMIVFWIWIKIDSALSPKTTTTEPAKQSQTIQSTQNPNLQQPVEQKSSINNLFTNTHSEIQSSAICISYMIFPDGPGFKTQALNVISKSSEDEAIDKLLLTYDKASNYNEIVNVMKNIHVISREIVNSAKAQLYNDIVTDENKAKRLYIALLSQINELNKASQPSISNDSVRSHIEAINNIKSSLEKISSSHDRYLAHQREYNRATEMSKAYEKEIKEAEDNLQKSNREIDEKLRQLKPRQ